MKMRIEVGAETRPAILRIPKVDSSGKQGGIHKESVFVNTLASCELAQCEHADGTLTYENWSHVKFLDSYWKFDETSWDETDV